MLHRGFHEFADVGKRGDLIEFGIDLPLAESQQRGVKKDVFAPGEFRIEAASQFEHGNDPPTGKRQTGGGGQDSRGDLKQRAFSRTVLADDPDALSPSDIKADIAQRPEFAVKLPPPADQALQKPVARMGVHLIAFTDAADREHQPVIQRGDAIR